MSDSKKKSSDKKSSDKKSKKSTKENTPSKSSSKKSLPPADAEGEPAISALNEKSDSVPYEIVSGRLLTHYDETAGVAIPRSSVETHKAMGNTVVPLVESYSSRYTKLRSLVTSRLLPRREHLLQLRRQLANSSAEAEAARKEIERETMADTERILERLRTVESMRQSSIHHEMLQVDSELNSIERLIRRVEQANEDKHYHGIATVNYASPSLTPLESVRAPKAALMVDVIQEFADIASTIDQIANKAVTIQVDFPVNDFPKETADRLAIISRCDKYAHALSVKDHMLWTAIQDKNKATELLEDEKRLCMEYAEEISNWAELSQNLTEKLQNAEQERDYYHEKTQQLLELLRENDIYVAHLE